MLRLVILLWVYLLLNFFVLGQEYPVEFLDIQKSTSKGASFIGIDNNGYVYCKGHKVIYALVTFMSYDYIKIYDSRTGVLMTEKRMNHVPELTKNGFIIIDFLVNNGIPVYLCKKRETQTDQDYYFVNVDERLTIISNPYKVGYSNNCHSYIKSDNYSKLYSFWNDNSDLNLFISDKTCKKDDFSNLHAVVLNLEQQKVSDFSFFIEENTISDLSVFMNRGGFYLSFSTEYKTDETGKLFKTKNTEKSLYRIDSIANLKKISLDVLSPGLELGAFKLINSNSSILFSGQIIDSENGLFKGICSGIVDVELDSVVNLKTTLFEEEFIQQYWTEKERLRNEKRKIFKDNEIGFTGNYKLLDYFQTLDGGGVYIYQKYWKEAVTVTRRDANGNIYYDTEYHYHYTDLIPIRLDNLGNLNWKKIIPVHQHTINFDPGTSILSVLKDDDIYIFYASSNVEDQWLAEGNKTNNIGKRKNNTLKNATISTINKNGLLITNSVFNLNQSKTFYFNPKNMGIDKNNNRIIIVNNTGRKKSRIISIRY